MTSLRQRRVLQEAMLLARHYGEAEYDDQGGKWLYLPSFPLPAGWDRPTTGLMWVLPGSYPHLPPDGFYVDRFLRTRHGKRIGHYFEERGTYNPYADRGWAWFCIHLHPGAWRPSGNVAQGDNLFKLAVLIRAILTEAQA